MNTYTKMLGGYPGRSILFSRSGAAHPGRLRDGLRQRGTTGGGSVAGAHPLAPTQGGVVLKGGSVHALARARGKDKETAAGLKSPALRLNLSASATACGMNPPLLPKGGAPEEAGAAELKSPFETPSKLGTSQGKPFDSSRASQGKPALH
jgi:hypothetical protein